MIIKNGQWTVYIHIFPNKKYYIGITSQRPEERWKKDGIGYSTQIVYKAIQKYGWNNIEHFIFAKNLTHKEACHVERLLISKLDSIKNGYNILNGGEGYSKFSDKDKEEMYSLWERGMKISQIANKFNSYYDVIKSSLLAKGITEEELLNRTSFIEKKYKKEILKQYYEGKSLTDISNFFHCSINTIRKILQRSGIFHEEIMEKYKTISSSQKEIIKKMLLSGKTEAYIANYYKTNRNTVSNFIKKYLSDLSPLILTNKYKFQSKKIKQLDLNGNLINTFPSIKEAAIAINNLNGRSHISDVCNGKRKTAYGYKWEFIINDIEGETIND